MKLSVFFSNLIAPRQNPNIGDYCAICGAVACNYSIWRRFAKGIYRGKSGIDPDDEGDGAEPGCGHNFIQSFIVHSNGKPSDIYTWLPCSFCHTEMIKDGIEMKHPHRIPGELPIHL